MATIILTTGVPGCGKTYVRAARFLVDDFLVNTKGIHISNFPLNIASISETVSEKINKNRGFFGIFRKRVTVSDIAKRLQIIPDDVLLSWRDGSSGPWDYFNGVDLKYCHIAIDEIHNYINARTSPDVLKKWDDFLGEVRHRGCTFEGLTQDFDQVDRVLSGRASIRLELIPGEDLRDPFFKIRMSDWYELKASFLGSYHKTVYMYEQRKSGSRWRINHTSRFLITPDYFKFYNSFNASLQEKEQGVSDDGRAVEYEYQRRTRISLFFWFIRRNFLTLFIRISLALFLFWLCFCGGLNFFIRSWLSLTSSMARSNSKSASVTKSVSVSSGSSQNQVPLSSQSISKEERKEALLKKEVQELGFKPGMFFDGKCWLRNGIRIYEGFKFNNREKHGIFYGKSVKKIDSSERNYLLDDGSLVDMY